MIRALGASGIVLSLAACAAGAPETAVPEGNWLLPGTSWKLVELDGAPFPANAIATLTEDGRITGRGPCNAFDAAYVGRWPDLEFDTAARTEVACPDLAEENAFFATLDKVNHAELPPDSLLLTGPDATSLRFVRAP